jgi:hypothetical protein
MSVIEYTLPYDCLSIIPCSRKISTYSWFLSMAYLFVIRNSTANVILLIKYIHINIYTYILLFQQYQAIYIYPRMNFHTNTKQVNNLFCDGNVVYTSICSLLYLLFSIILSFNTYFDNLNLLNDEYRTHDNFSPICGSLKFHGHFKCKVNVCCLAEMSFLCIYYMLLFKIIKKIMLGRQFILGNCTCIC